MTWMELNEIEQVLEKVAAPPPEGFRIKTHISGAFTAARKFVMHRRISHGSRGYVESI